LIRPANWIKKSWEHFFFVNKTKSDFWVFCSRVTENALLLECDAALLGNRIPTFTSYVVTYLRSSNCPRRSFRTKLFANSRPSLLLFSFGETKSCPCVIAVSSGRFISYEWPWNRWR
jgi:hypothetical protein